MKKQLIFVAWVAVAPAGWVALWHPIVRGGDNIIPIHSGVAFVGLLGVIALAVLLYAQLIDVDSNINDLENRARIQIKDKLIEREYAENAALQLVEHSLASDCGEVLGLDKRFLELAMEQRARAYHEAHAGIVEAQIKRYDPDGPGYRELDEKLKEARTAYWALSDKLQKTRDRPKKNSWRHDLPLDLKDCAWESIDGRLVPVG